MIGLCVRLADPFKLSGWRQHEHLLTKTKRIVRRIERISARKGPGYRKRLDKPYRELLKVSGKILSKARQLCLALQALGVEADSHNLLAQLQTFMQRTEHVRDTAYRRVLQGESVPNSDKLFSIFEPHTQLYKRGKAGEPIQFGRLVLVFEDAAGFIVHQYLMPRDAQDKDVVVEQTRVLQEKLGGAVERLSFDRGFHTPENQQRLAELVLHPCLPKPGVKQSAQQQETATVQFRQAHKNHPGIESAIGALQSGNGLQRCRDRTEVGFGRYMALAILGRNLQTLGKWLLARDDPASNAAFSRRKSAA